MGDMLLPSFEKKKPAAERMSVGSTDLSNRRSEQQKAEKSGEQTAHRGVIMVWLWVPCDLGGEGEEADPGKSGASPHELQKLLVPGRDKRRSRKGDP